MLFEFQISDLLTTYTQKYYTDKEKILQEAILPEFILDDPFCEKLIVSGWKRDKLFKETHFQTLAQNYLEDSGIIIEFGNDYHVIHYDETKVNIDHPFIKHFDKCKRKLIKRHLDEINFMLTNKLAYRPAQKWRKFTGFEFIPSTQYLDFLNKYVSNLGYQIKLENSSIYICKM